ncbi:MAG TPA: sugar phosphate isomerase/epimerase family protein [Acidobacteriota bacterium]|nr:sugar phosphate isomerase/epimerase family protein [Acidobacteriota bacterium]
MKLGVGTYAFMWSIGFPGAEPEQPMRALDLVEKAQSLGVDVIQFGPNLPLERLDPGERAEVLAALQGYGLELEIGTEGLEQNHLLRMLDFCQACGARLLRTVPSLPEDRAADRLDLEAALTPLREAFLASGVRLGLENYLTPAETMAAALDNLGTSHFGVVLDTVNSLAIPEGTREVVRSLAKHTVCLHVKDFVVRREWHRMGFRVEGRPAGRGQLEIPWLLDQLRRCGFAANVILELWVPQQDRLSQTIVLEHEWARQSVQYLRTLF